jgi:hypothetical protein
MIIKNIHIIIGVFIKMRCSYRSKNPRWKASQAFLRSEDARNMLPRRYCNSNICLKTLSEKSCSLKSDSNFVGCAPRQKTFNVLRYNV